MNSTALSKPLCIGLVCCVVVICRLSAAGSSGSNISFLATRNFPAGTNPGSVITSDVNRDGKFDAVVLNGGGFVGGPGSISVLLGNGDGTLQSPQQYAVGIDPRAIQVADFNGDGKVDIAVLDFGTSTMSIAVLLGNGDGTFQAPLVTNLNAPSPGAIGQLIAGDFDRNGNADLAVLVALPQVGTTAISVLLSNGDGTFQFAKSYDAGVSDYIIAAADFNGDGKLDLFAARSGAPLGSVAVLLGNGDGTFQTPIVTQGEPGGNVIADFDQDGNLDVVGGTEIMLGNGDGTFKPAVAWTTNPVLGGGAFFVATGDLNGDGIPDLVTVGTSVAEQLIFLGNGDGTFTQLGTLGPGVFWDSAIGDFNGDGKQDIVAIGGTASLLVGGTASVLLGNGDGTFQLSISLLNNMTGCPIVGGTGDFNGDGQADLLFWMQCQSTVLGVGAVAVSSGNGDGTFQSLVISDVGNTPLSAAISDLNGDGKLDLAVGGTGLMILPGNGDGTFQAPGGYSMGGLAETIADFNSDGKLDVASVGLCPVSVGLVFGNGDGTFGYPSFFTLSPPPNSCAAAALASADFNHDGSNDIAVASSFGTIAILLGDGKGSFSEHDIAAGSYVTSIAVGDLNGDGNPDVAFASSTYGYPNASPSSPLDNTIGVLIGNGDGTFQSPVYYPVGLLPLSIAVHDLNGDGILDIVSSNGSLPWPAPPAASATISILLGKGDGTFLPSINYDADLPGVIAIADFNGDGLPDLAVGNQLYLNRTPGITPYPIVQLSALTLNLGSTAVNSTSSAPIALTNAGNAPLSFKAKLVGGPEASEFSESDNCFNLAPNASCTVTVQFAPNSAGKASATLSIFDNALNSPQVVGLAGAGSDFGLSESPSTLTIKAGSTGTFTLTVAPLSGFAQTVQFSCAGLPPQSSCSFQPQSVAPAGVAATSAVTITTVASSAMAANRQGMRLSVLLLDFVLCASFFVFREKRCIHRKTMATLAMCAGIFWLAACGGSGGSGTSSTTGNPGTPTGSYTLTLSAVSGTGNTAISHKVTLTLVVD